MYPLIRRYLRRVDVFYLLLCAACSALSVVVLVSIGQTQLGSNNKASVQLIASLLGLMLAVVFSTADYHALARAAARRGGLGAGAAHPVFAQRQYGACHNRVRRGRHLQLQLVPRRRHDVPTRRAGKNQLYFDIGAAFEQRARPGQ